MPRVRYRPRAATDIAEMWDYIAEDSVARADAWVDRLDETLMLLSTRPLMGRDRHSLAHGLRSPRLAATSSSTRRPTTG